MNHDHETWVTLSDSVKKTCVKRLLAEKSRLRHIRLAIKPSYLGNNASQIKSYEGSLPGSHVRPLRNHDDVMSGLQQNHVISETTHPRFD